MNSQSYTPLSPLLSFFMLSLSPLEAVSLVVVVSSVFLYGRRRNAKLPFPPGPKGYPVIGNVFDIPQGVPAWKAAMSMGETYSERLALAARGHKLISGSSDSDVLYLNILGADQIILNSNEAISDLLDKRSTIYSDRVRALGTNRASAW